MNGNIVHSLLFQLRAKEENKQNVNLQTSNMVYADLQSLAVELSCEQVSEALRLKFYTNLSCCCLDGGFFSTYIQQRTPSEQVCVCSSPEMLLESNDSWLNHDNYRNNRNIKHQIFTRNTSVMSYFHTEIQSSIFIFFCFPFFLRK